MKKYYLFFVLNLLCLLSNATNYYVDAVNGSNGNSGLSTGLAFKSIPTAAALTNAGDTVFIMNGAYSPFTITRPGNATAQIVYTNYPGHTPQIVSTNSTYIAVTVNPGANYVTVNGLEVIGWGVNLTLANDTIPAQAAIVCAPGATSTTNVTFIPKYNGSGINIGGSSVITHHVVISNNKIHDCAAVGIGSGYSDYITIDHNTVYNNSWYTPYGTSGISFGNSTNYDNNITTYRNIVSNNICYGNRLYVLWRGSCTISDGNGIILDVPQLDTVTGSPTKGKPLYTGKQLVVNNVCFNNGGSGIHTLNNNNVDFIHNTAYLNAASPTNNGGSIYAYGSANPNFFNNIIVARPGKPVNKCPSSTNVVYDYNVYNGGTTPNFVGVHSLIQDPSFVNPSTDPTVADFHLQPGSFAVNNGDNTHTYPTDRDGTGRPIASVVDIGAYESSYSGNLNTYSTAPTTQVLGNGGGTGLAGATFYGPYDSYAGTNGQQSRRAFIYPQTLISSKNVPSNCLLTSLQFYRGTGGNTQVEPANSTVRIYLRNEASDNFGTSAFDWTTILPGAGSPALLVYGGDASPLIGNASGWQTVTFQIPFNYTGANLGVYIEYLQNSFISGGISIPWVYDNGGSQPLYNTATYPNQLYATKYIGTSGSSTISNSLTTNSERRPIMAVGYTTATILPVTFQQFNAVKKTGGVYVNWLLGSETNNTGFDVQRSKDGVSFTTIGFVASKAPNGTSTSAEYYDFTDANPLDGTCFYRLLQKDKDGKQSYSSIASVSSVAKTLDLVAVYPNPVSTKLTALINVTGPNQVATISLHDLSGKTLNKFQQQLPSGYSNIELNLSKQASSTYILVIEFSSGEKLTTKVIKL